jgi:hypothetical protein
MNLAKQKWKAWPKNITNIDVRALVNPTFMRRKSDTKPMPFPWEARTQEKIATSFSRPWIVQQYTTILVQWKTKQHSGNIPNRSKEQNC